LYINTQRALEEFVAASVDASILAVDTEFLREKTYYPQLCLLQIATEKHEALIDPFAKLDLKALVPLLADGRAVKVFHAGDQDRAILYQVLGAVVRPVFDTQRAALPLGLPQQMSLTALVKHYCDVSLKKGESFSDWAQRPLTQTQLAYAADDVRYLPAVYRKMTLELTESGRLSWLDDDLREMEDEDCYRVEPQDVWRKLKGVSALRGSQLAVIREIAAWREQVAQRRNLPRKWILSDELLVEIARREPDSLEDLFRTRTLKEKLGRKWSQEVLVAIRRAQSFSPDEWPVREPLPNRDAGTATKLDLMNAVLHHRAKELRIASTFLANRDELTRLAAGQREDLMILKGWRRELVGDELLRLLNGMLSLSLVNDELKVTLLSQAGPSPAQ
jgi:ribonuclease D